MTGRGLTGMTAVDRATVTVLRDFGPVSGWPRGWWRQPTQFPLGCVHQGTPADMRVCRPIRPPPGALIYLTGIDGEVYCEKHAPSEAPKLSGGAT